MKIEYSNVIQIISPDPDSHFRLRSCKKCGGNNVAFVQRQIEAELWSAECFDCGYAGESHQTRHGAQIQWNGTMLNKLSKAKERDIQ